MSFVLSIKNAPLFSKYWFANFSRGEAYSDWLGIDEPWNYPYGAYGATDLEIMVVDSNYDIKHSITGLGPIYDGKTYVYDCSTRILSEVAPPTGIISRKELEYNSARKLIPASDGINTSHSGLVHVRGRNDSSQAIKLGIAWTVTDPYGNFVEEYSDWEFGTTNPGQEHEFIGGRFNLNVPGWWNLYVALYAYPDIVLANYYGYLCYVGVMEAVFSNFNILEYMKL